MTYIIAEPCIDIKDLSCVDVCPVDCIHEFERILIIDPEECIDCFAPSEQLLTSRGVRTFVELEGQTCRVLTDDGLRPAVVKRFNRNPLAKLELAPAFEERSRHGGTRLTTRNISKFRRTVWATPTHSWPLADGQRTDSLALGQFVQSASVRAERDSETYRLGVLHGLVFGDGSWNKQEIRSGQHLHYVQLYGEKVAKFKDFFDQVNFSPCLDVHPGYVGTGVVRAPVNLKRSLPETGDVEYIAGFVDGWLAADGVYTHNCGACEPECPVEAIFPEDALPEKWNDFVKINYAYGDGADVINNLTNEYATEHNVQNPPLEG